VASSKEERKTEKGGIVIAIPRGEKNKGESDSRKSVLATTEKDLWK